MSNASARDSWTLTGKSGLVSLGITPLLLSPESWCLQDFVRDLQEPVSPVLKFYSQIPLAFKVKFPEDAQALLDLWVGDLANCSAVCGSFARQRCGGANGDLLQEDLCHRQSLPGLLQPEPLSPQQATADSCLRRKHSDSGLSVSCGVPGSWFTQGFVCTLQVSLESMRFDSKCNLAPLLSCWGFSLAPGHRVSFFGGIQHSPVNGFSAASCNFGVLTGENEWTSFYSTILDAMKLSSLSHLGNHYCCFCSVAQSCPTLCDSLLELIALKNCKLNIQ